ADIDARTAAARVLAASGRTAEAAARFRALADDLRERRRDDEALAALREAVRLDPGDVAGRTELARACLARGDAAGAREFLDRATAGDDPELLAALAEIELRAGVLDEARAILRRVIELAPGRVDQIVDLGWAFCESSPEAAFACIDVASDAAIAAGDFERAAAILQEYVGRASLQVPALLKLVEVCVDGGLESTMYETQARLCDAYLAAGQALEARVIAEDLVAREPWEQVHIERFRRALTMLGVADPDSVIAERLSGQVPFLATDRFAEDLAEPALGAIGALDSALAAPAAPPAEPAAAPNAGGATSVQSESAPAVDTGTAETEEVVELDLTDALDQEAAPPPAWRGAREDAGTAAEQQLALARTYLESGLVEDALEALAQAARSPRHRFEAASTLARLYRERNRPALAVEWLERAAEAPAPSAEAGRALLYELGVLLEETGETTRALAVFLELLADAGEYKDAQARADRLAKVEMGG
ncbi:MAG TPA: tetratricopeptide repeat protein, partial [Vicinamibacterales bacterium]|nr:tetratricopeptide repeat protein [Vicinamibacterales bacterium]